jgi:hypothetical protein
MTLKRECCMCLFKYKFWPRSCLYAIKTCLVISANHLELFSINFGATFVFKISPNFAFKNILEKLEF